MSRRMTGAVLLGLAAAGAVTAFTLRDSQPAVDPEVAALWERVRAANSAWLDPAPAAITIRANSLTPNSRPDNGEKRRRAAEAEIMAAEGRNARFLRRLFAGAEVIENESRYAGGVGGQLTRVPQPVGRLRQERLAQRRWQTTQLAIGRLDRARQFALVAGPLERLPTAAPPDHQGIRQQVDQDRKSQNPREPAAAVTLIELIQKCFVRDPPPQQQYRVGQRHPRRQFLRQALHGHLPNAHTSIPCAAVAAMGRCLQQWSDDPTYGSDWQSADATLRANYQTPGRRR